MASEHGLIDETFITNKLFNSHKDSSSFVNQEYKQLINDIYQNNKDEDGQFYYEDEEEDEEDYDESFYDDDAYDDEEGEYNEIEKERMKQEEKEIEKELRQYKEFDYYFDVLKKEEEEEEKQRRGKIRSQPTVGGIGVELQRNLSGFGNLHLPSNITNSNIGREQESGIGSVYIEYDNDGNIPIKSGIDRVYMTEQMRRIIEEEEEIKKQINEEREKMRELTAQEKEQKGTLLSHFLGYGVYHLADYAYFFGDEQNSQFPSKFYMDEIYENRFCVKTIQLQQRKQKEQQGFVK
ncbi:MAG: hypothetical protein EZS28_018328 [Streblomastix strix]|uniref:Uncharacterized protein n=1 Tax=Streblomastix strix TaxID=222440 RepID=A0A5J4VUK8_9EUKA|nr:MAG: hypothetical protein EZS28_018328 [Streblomastix strix]